MEAAFFDLDKTVIAKASMVAFGRPLYRAGLISRWLVLRALWGQLVYLHLGADEQRMARMQESVLRLTRGWEQAKVSDVVRETLEEVIEPIVYAEAIDSIREHQRAGRLVFIVSASPIEVVAPLALYLGVDDAIATQALVDDEGRYTGEVEFYSYGPFKAEAMARLATTHGFDLRCCYAYSDSITDLPMLEAVGHPVAVNADRELQRVARERGWELVNYGQEVALRERVAMPSPAYAAAGAAGLAGVVAGAVVWWWLRRPTADEAARSGVPSRRRGGASGDQAERTFFAATTARATNTARMSSLFMARKLTQSRRPTAARSPDRRRFPWLPSFGPAAATHDQQRHRSAGAHADGRSASSRLPAWSTLAPRWPPQLPTRR